jgi:hypothetical protein
VDDEEEEYLSCDLATRSNRRQRGRSLPPPPPPPSTANVAEWLDQRLK